MAKSGNTMWNGRYGGEESSRRKSYKRTAELDTHEKRQKYRDEILRGKKEYESKLPKSNVVVPIEFIKSAIKRKGE